MEHPTLTLAAGGVSYSVTFDRWDALQHNRARWIWAIVETGGDILAYGDDITTVCAGNPNDAEALNTLLTFLSAHVEAVDYERRTGRTAENADLFPRSLTDRVALDADEITMLAESVEVTR